ncbi:MAG: alpha-mannosidase, partial [Clostridia bacterium]|nr:alpha-mannosidase [Clostridia bacterium]
RCEYEISKKSTVKQDIIFFADSAEVRFDTAMDWNDDHRFLKAAFDTCVYDDFARNEIQFGYAKRPTTRNNSIEEAKFEVVNHKYTDLSEAKYGIAILNDCKYGITIKEGSLRLSLHKGGTHPDYKGDKDGIHRCVYSLLPHNCAFDAKSVIEPSYMLNIPVVVASGEAETAVLAKIDSSNIIIEAIKPCEDSEKAYIVRLYEAEGSYTNAVFDAADCATKVEVTNMLEEVQSELAGVKNISLTFRPFEIKTLKVSY